MTKPANFPERKNQRRKVALARMERGGEYVYRTRDMTALGAVMNTDARGVRTKKLRAGRAKGNA
jgi:hypothetical protein